MSTLIEKEQITISLYRARKDASDFLEIGKSLVDKANDLSIVKNEDKQIAEMLKKECLLTSQNLELKRKEITIPVNQFLDEVNTLFKQVSASILEAQNTTKQKILAYNQEQERIRLELEEKALVEERERLRKLEVERLEREKIEQKKREEEQAKLKAEQDRLKKLEEERQEKEFKAKQMNEAEQKKIREEAEKQRLEREKLQNEKLEIERMKREAEEEKTRLQEEKRLMDEKKLADDILKRKEEEMKQKGIFKRWTWEIIEEEKVPRTFCTPDNKKINQAIKSGIREIEGIRIFQAVSVK